MRDIQSVRLLKLRLMHVVLGSVLGMSLVSSQNLWACMPHSPDDVFIARVQSIAPLKTPDQSSNFVLQFAHPQFILRRLDFDTGVAFLQTKFRSIFQSRPEQWHSAVEFKQVQQNELVIGLAYAADGNLPEIYTVSSLAVLSCTADKLSIGSPLKPFLVWDREAGRCSMSNVLKVGLLDGFLTHDQAYYLQQLQRQYPTCAALETAFPRVKSPDLQPFNPVTNASDSKGSASQSETHYDLSLWQRFKNWFGQWF